MEMDIQELKYKVAQLHEAILDGDGQVQELAQCLVDVQKLLNKVPELEGAAYVASMSGTHPYN